MSKYKIGDRIFVPYGHGDTGRIVDIKRVLWLKQYIILSDSYETLEVLYRYFGWSISFVGKSQSSPN